MASQYSLVEVLGPVLVNHKGEEVSTESLRGKTVGLYFSASWCPPCRQFTPVLAEVYNKLATSKPGEFEVVFVSSDRAPDAFNEYWGKMPWLALPFAERSQKEKAAALHKVRGIPTLVLYDGEGKAYTTEGRAEVSDFPEGFPWKD